MESISNKGIMSYARISKYLWFLGFSINSKRIFDRMAASCSDGHPGHFEKIENLSGQKDWELIWSDVWCIWFESQQGADSKSVVKKWKLKFLNEIARKQKKWGEVWQSILKLSTFCLFLKDSKTSFQIRCQIRKISTTARDTLNLSFSRSILNARSRRWRHCVSLIVRISLILRSAHF